MPYPLIECDKTILSTSFTTKREEKEPAMHDRHRPKSGDTTSSAAIAESIMGNSTCYTHPLAFIPRWEHKFVPLLVGVSTYPLACSVSGRPRICSWILPCTNVRCHITFERCLAFSIAFCRFQGSLLYLTNLKNHMSWDLEFPLWPPSRP
ncbi:hypothetical protein K432DRAFT_41786 [Lepidopterella palustris CBS 459.81]|uniref:Uncharacterized protein n=1 Tax=Lepidopterella palustris CBS 459.81 TaxID=1314670 RepID=A0A8E2EAR2_9PEZI|nr:hypothetical protein K432DRAFT_41786 [Lepidopterella palustris CBS 459.81]